MNIALVGTCLLVASASAAQESPPATAPSSAEEVGPSSAEEVAPSSAVEVVDPPAQPPPSLEAPPVAPPPTEAPPVAPPADVAPESIAAAFLAIVEIHGFGNWSAGWSSGDPYGHARGQVPNLFDVEAAPFFVARPVEPLTIYIQPFFAVSADELSASLNFAFAEWRFSDEIALRMGQVSQPFGLYNEILDIGVLQPFTLLPQSVYGPTGMVIEGHPGVGLTGAAAPGDIELRWDVYGGSLVTKGDDPANEHIKTILGGEAEEEEETIDAMAGGRLIVTVADGLDLGASAWGGYIIKEEEATGSMGLHAEWLRDNFKLRAELASRVIHYGELELSNIGYGGYVEGTLMGGNGPQLVGRVDAYTNTFFGNAAVTAEAERLAPALSHVESAVGVNWQFAPNLVVKSAYHLVFGHRFAHQENLAESLDDDATLRSLAPFTHVVQLGAAFSF
ncbi:MAG: hypothetical protein Q8O67_09595 [Deltaproteobacteria bacterium]|nr:hypothetical protein [Deltaproteobacteria bacterium]